MRWCCARCPSAERGAGAAVLQSARRRGQQRLPARGRGLGRGAAGLQRGDGLPLHLRQPHRRRAARAAHGGASHPQLPLRGGRGARRGPPLRARGCAPRVGSLGPPLERAGHAAVRLRRRGRGSDALAGWHHRADRRGDAAGLRPGRFLARGRCLDAPPPGHLSGVPGQPHADRDGPAEVRRAAGVRAPGRPAPQRHAARHERAR